MRRILFATTLLLGLSLGSLPAADAASIGSVTLYQNPDFTGSARAQIYTGCLGTRTQIAGTVASFDNRPLPGCEVVLVKGSQTFELCAGRGVVPAALRSWPTLRIQPGSSVACAW